MKDINGHESNSLFNTDIGLLCSDCYTELLEMRQQEMELGIMDAAESFYEPRLGEYLGK